MKNKLLILFLAFLSFSCFDKEDAPARLQSGTYVGTFTRSSPAVNYVAANVTLVLTDNGFSGNSDKPLYPAIGKGTYKVEGHEVTFHDEMMWPAHFDWSLILNDKFALSTDSQGGIILTRQRGDVTDVYRLVRQNEK